MGGIAATFGFADKEQLQKMLKVIRHRGIDGTNLGVVDGLCGMGSNVIAINGLQNHKQLISNEEGSAFIVLDGRIYNSRILREKLSMHEFATNTDAEVILHLYEEKKERCVRELEGVFSLFIYDVEDKSFYAARDSLGVKPLYYTMSKGNYLFASELKAFLDLDFASIHLLSPGCYMKPRYVKRFYRVPAKLHHPDIARLRNLLDSSVRKRLTQDLPLGTFLSGGIDSSIVTALASKYVDNLRTFTVGMQGSMDVVMADRVSKYLNVDNIIRVFDEDEMFKVLPKVIWHLEKYNSILVTNAIPTLFSSELAREFVGVALCGEGGDEIFGGYDYLKQFKDSLNRRLRILIRNLHRTECQRVDRMSMAFSLEVRVPFLDLMFFEYAFNLPNCCKIGRKDGRTFEKLVLRKAFDDALPSEVVWRPKCPFDKGSGASKINDIIDKQISDREFRRKKKKYREWKIENKPMLYFFEIWKDLFNPHLILNDELLMCGYYPMFKIEMKWKRAKANLEKSY